VPRTVCGEALRALLLSHPTTAVIGDAAVATALSVARYAWTEPRWPPRLARRVRPGTRRVSAPYLPAVDRRLSACRRRRSHADRATRHVPTPRTRSLTWCL